MKFTSNILLALLVLLVVGLLSSNIILKKEYDKVDKSDIYWNYEKILQQPFKYLKITGGTLPGLRLNKARNIQYVFYKNGKGITKVK